MGHKALDITKLLVVKKQVHVERTPSLIDQHVPRSLSEIVGCIGSPTAVNFANQQLAAYVPGKRCIAICGASGLGKTVMGRILLRQHGYSDVLEVDLVNMQLPQMSADKTLVCRLVSEVEGYSAKRPLLLDGADSPAWTETSGLSAMARKRQAPTIVVCDETKKPRSRTCDTVVLRRPTVPQLVLHLHKSFPNIDSKAMTGIVEKAKCDIRHILANIESLMSGNAAWGHRDDFMDGTESIMHLFSEASTGDLEHVSRLGGIGDSHALVHENYLDSKSADIDSTAAIHSAAAAADWLSIGDMVEHRLYSQQAWQLYDFRLLAGSVAPAFCTGPLKGDVRPSTQRGHQSRRRTVLTKIINDRNRKQ